MQILAHISQQLQQTSPDSSATAVVQPPPFSVSDSAIRINILWFLSLTLSMATALVCILCMQWLREFTTDAARSHKNAIAFRQMRFEGLLAWKVPLILSLLPIFLKFSLVLFFAGVLELLWARNYVVGLTVSVVSGAVMFFRVRTTILPAFQYLFTTDLNLRVVQCPYKSPQSWGLYRLSLRITRLYRLIITWSAKIILVFHRHILVKDIEAQEPVSRPNAGSSQSGRFDAVHRDNNWNDYDIRWPYMRDATFFDEESGEPCRPKGGQDLINGLKWIDQTFSEDIDAVHLIFWCVRDLGTIQAAQMVSELDPDVSYLTSLLFPSGPRQPSFYEGLPVPDRQIREHTFTLFLWLHKHIHPSLNESYMERTNRLMNTSSKCIPNLALRQPENDLTDVSFGDTSSLHLLLSLSNQTRPEIHLQLFHSLKNVIAADVITRRNACEIWAFLNDLYVNVPYPPEPFLTTTFEHFNLWLGPPADMPKYREHVETCVAGVTQVFTSMNGANISTLRVVSPSFFKLDRIGPLQELYLAGRPPTSSDPYLIVIDGLDECADPQVQTGILRSISKAVKRCQFPLKFLIASRPEPHLTILVSEVNDSIGILEHHSAVLRGLNKRRWPELMRKLIPATVPVLYIHEAAAEIRSQIVELL